MIYTGQHMHVLFSEDRLYRSKLSYSTAWCVVSPVSIPKANLSKMHRNIFADVTVRCQHHKFVYTFGWKSILYNIGYNVYVAHSVSRCQCHHIIHSVVRRNLKFVIAVVIHLCAKFEFIFDLICQFKFSYNEIRKISVLFDSKFLHFLLSHNIYSITAADNSLYPRIVHVSCLYILLIIEQTMHHTMYLHFW